jgi:RsiW-degrading membrane proteinase PrsW (M82 family)
MQLLSLTLKEFLILSGMAVPAVFAWYFVFRYNNPRCLHRSTVRDTFIFGLISVAPMFLYQYVYQHYYPQIEASVLSRVTIDSGLLGILTDSLMAFVGLGFAFYFFIAVAAIFYSLFRSSTFRNLKSILEEPLNLGATAIILLLIVAVEFIFEPQISKWIIAGLIGQTFILAVLEEYSKHLVVRVYDDDKVKNIANAIEFSIIVALSFAFVENVVYFSVTSETTTSLIIGRSVISMLGHVTFSSIFGYYYGLSKFSDAITALERIEHHEPKIPHFLHRFFHLNTAHIFRHQKIFEGLVFAALVHTLFNILLAQELIYGIIPILVFGAWLIYELYSSPIVEKQFSVVGTEAMPLEDFEEIAEKVEEEIEREDLNSDSRKEKLGFR